jgi:putative flippase GtrA
LLKKILSEKVRIAKFITVGLGGTIVNLTLVWLGNSFLFKSLGEPHQTWMSYALAIIVSIFSNYVFNYLWTWRDCRGQGVAAFFSHLWKYYLINMAAAGLQFLIANGLIVILFTGTVVVPVFWKMGASLVGIGMAGAINFLVNHFWNFNVSVNKRIKGEA